MTRTVKYKAIEVDDHRNGQKRCQRFRCHRFEFERTTGWGHMKNMHTNRKKLTFGQICQFSVAVWLPCTEVSLYSLVKLDKSSFFNQIWCVTPSIKFNVFGLFLDIPCNDYFLFVQLGIQQSQMFWAITYSSRCFGL